MGAAAWDAVADRTTDDLVALAIAASQKDIESTKHVLMAHGLGATFADKEDLAHKVVQHIKPDEAEELWKGLKAIADAPPFVPLTTAQKQQLYDLLVKKGGAKNPKVAKLMKSYAVPLKLSGWQDIPGGSTGLSKAEHDQLTKALKKLKMAKATRKQVGTLLSLLMQVDPAKWKANDLSKEWPAKALRAQELMKHTSVEIQHLTKQIKDQFKVK